MDVSLLILELARELEAQGLSRKVTADMFGMALRSYQRKVQRLQESGTEGGRTLWEAVYDFVRSREVVSRAEVIDRFRSDEEALVRGVLNDLTESGLVFATGPSQDTSFRAATDRELRAIRARPGEHTDEIAWALVFRTGPTTAAALGSLGQLHAEEVTASLERLSRTGRIERAESPDGPLYSSGRLHVPLGSESGWEAAVLDHYHAMVRTIAAKLRQSTARSSLDDEIGGSTYGFEVWRDHPLEGEVRGALRRFREEHSRLRQRVRDYNAAHEKPKERQAVVVYGGQCVWELEHEEALFT